jgi:hypothetical protein
MCGTQEEMNPAFVSQMVSIYYQNPEKALITLGCKKKIFSAVKTKIVGFY